MKIIYNEWDRPTAAWLSELGRAGAIPRGRVITKSITEIRAEEVRDARQFHAFAGIGGWPQALRLAGYGDLPCWTGSPPCQPFSVAGRRLAQADERHLAPVWLNLVRECRPPSLFGEQVADAIRHGWLDDLFNALEDCGYACGAAVLPACSIGAPHIRKRLIFGAVRVEDSGRQRIYPLLQRAQSGGVAQDRAEINGRGASYGLADSHDQRPQGRAGVSERTDEQPSGARSVESRSARSHHGGWSGTDWLGCRDGKFRPVEPGTQPLADGVPARVGRLRGYGNAIIPKREAQFIRSFMESIRAI